MIGSIRMGKFNKKETLRAQQAWRDAKKDIEFAMDYPPFHEQEEDDDGFSMSLGTEDFMNIKKDFLAEVSRIQQEISKSDVSDPTTLDPDVFNEPFAKIEKKYADQLEEARLWMKRFPTEPDKAVRKKLKG